MSPEQKALLDEKYEEILANIAKSEALLGGLDGNYTLLEEAGKLAEDIEQTLQGAMDCLEEVTNRMKLMQERLEKTVLADDYSALKTEIDNLLADYRLYYVGALEDNDTAEQLLQSDESVESDEPAPPVQPPPSPVILPPPSKIELTSVTVLNIPVNLEAYPPECTPYGTFKNMAPKVGDGHACVPKLIYFGLKTGTAKLVTPENETPETLYHEIVEGCQIFSQPQNLKQIMWIPEAKQVLSNALLRLKNNIEKIHYDPEAVQVFLGDLFMDRYGNDIITALFIKRIGACGSRLIIPISNHDVRFIFWLIKGMSDMILLSTGRSSEGFNVLTAMGITSKDEIMAILDESYFKNLVAIYYEIAPDNTLTNIGTHAPNGDWETYEIAQGVSQYAAMDQYQHLFTESQRTRLKLISQYIFDPLKGLSSPMLRVIIDMLNEIIHTNAIKKDKDHLSELLHLGYAQLTPDQANGYGIPPRLAPFYRLIWNRDSPRAAPPQAEPRNFQNGHDLADRYNSYGKPWMHNNVSFDELAGKSADNMKAVMMRYALPVTGYTPMPKIVLPPTPAPEMQAPDPRARDRSPPARVTHHYNATHNEEKDEDEDENQDLYDRGRKGRPPSSE